MCTKLPGKLIDPKKLWGILVGLKTGVVASLKGMFDVEADLEASSTSYLAGVVLPTKLRACMCGMMMNDTDNIFSLLERYVSTVCSCDRSTVAAARRGRLIIKGFCGFFE